MLKSEQKGTYNIFFSCIPCIDCLRITVNEFMFTYCRKNMWSQWHIKQKYAEIFRQYKASFPRSNFILRNLYHAEKRKEREGSKVVLKVYERPKTFTLYYLCELSKIQFPECKNREDRQFDSLEKKQRYIIDIINNLPDSARNCKRR